MPKLRFGLACLRAVTDRETNLATYVDVLEGVISSVMPFDMPSLYVCINLMREAGDPDEFVCRLRCVDPSGKTFREDLTLNVSFEGKLNLRINFQVEGFTIDTGGTYKFAAEFRTDDSKWKKVGSIPLDVR